VQKVAWSLLPLALLGGAVLGYFGRGQQTKTTTVVQVQTVAAPPPATHLLRAFVQGTNGQCVTAVTSDDLSTHAWTLRRPGNGLTDGDVVAVAQTDAMDTSGCNFDVTFKISPKLGFFMVSDDSKGNSLGPFDSQQMAAQGWAVRLNEGS
jgi:hypothetical protein